MVPSAYALTAHQSAGVKAGIALLREFDRRRVPIVLPLLAALHRR